MEKAIYSKLGIVFRDQLVRWRKHKGLSQKSLGELIGRDRSMVARIENGERRVDVVELYEIMRALNLDPVEESSKIMALFQRVNKVKFLKERQVSFPMLQAVGREIEKCRSWKSLIKVTLTEIDGLNLGDYVSWNELSPEGKLLKVFDSKPIEKDMPKTIAKINQHLDDNPLIKLFQMTKMDYEFRQFADFAEYSLFHETLLYKNVYKKSGIHNQLGGALYFTDKRLIALVINRGSGQPFFSNRDKRLMTYLRPVIARTCARLDTDRDSISDLQFHQPELLKYSQILRITNHGEILKATDLAKKFLEFHFDWSKQQKLIPSSISKGITRLANQISKDKEKTPVGWLPSMQEHTIIGYYIQDSPYPRDKSNYLYLWALNTDADSQLPEIEQQALVDLTRGLSTVELADKLKLTKQEMDNLLQKLNASLERAGELGSFLDKLNYQSFRQLSSL